MSNINPNTPETLLHHYIADGITQEFIYTFSIESIDDILVYVENKEITSGYTITEKEIGGVIKFSQAPDANTSVTIQKYLQLKAKILISPSTKYLSPQTLKLELDNLLDLIKQSTSSNERALILPIGLNNVNTTLPMPIAEKALVWNSQANALVNSKTSIFDTDKALTDALADTKQNTILTLEAAEKAQISADIAVQKADEVINNIGFKANANLDNVSSDSGLRKLIEVYKNGSSWYKIFEETNPETGEKLKWCEQGGSGASGGSITLLKPYIDTNYYITIATITTFGSRINATWVTGKSVNSFSSHGGNYSYNYSYGISWYTNGIINEGIQ